MGLVKDNIKLIEETILEAYNLYLELLEDNSKLRLNKSKMVQLGIIYNALVVLISFECERDMKTELYESLIVPKLTNGDQFRSMLFSEIKW